MACMISGRFSERFGADVAPSSSSSRHYWPLHTTQLGETQLYKKESRRDGAPRGAPRALGKEQCLSRTRHARRGRPHAAQRTQCKQTRPLLCRCAAVFARARDRSPAVSTSAALPAVLLQRQSVASKQALARTRVSHTHARLLVRAGVSTHCRAASTSA
jgi:hypothetical protein